MHLSVHGDQNREPDHTDLGLGICEPPNLRAKNLKGQFMLLTAEPFIHPNQYYKILINTFNIKASVN